MKTEEELVIKNWKKKKASTRAMTPTSTMSEPVMEEKSVQTDPEKKDMSMQTELVDAEKVDIKGIEVQCDENFGGEPGIYFSDRVDFQFDRWGKLYFVHRFAEDLELDDVVEEDDDFMSITSDLGEPPGLGDSEDEEDVPEMEDCRLTAKQMDRRQRRKEREGFRLFGPQTESVLSDDQRSNGICLPLLMMPGPEETINDDHSTRKSPKAKPHSAVGRRARWRHKKDLAKFNLATGEIQKSVD